MKRKSSILLTLVLVLGLVLIMAGPMASPVQAKDTGPTNGSTAANNSSVGTEPWSNPSKALVQNNDPAYTLLLEGYNTSYYLKVTDFGFDIPGSATIEGIVVEVDRYSTGVLGIVSDHSIRLVKGGTIMGANRSEGAAWPFSDADDYESYGNSSDRWGEDWEAADINHENFGVAISAVLDSSVGRNAWVDHIQITVHYSVDEYYLTMGADPESGGEAIDKTGDPTYVEDDNVEIEAVPATGYEFVEWTSAPTAGGTPTSDLFDEPEEEETTFTMPAYNVTVTAHFEMETGPEVDPTVTTLDASGISQYVATLNMNFDVGDWVQVQLRFAHREYGASNGWHYTEWITRTEPDEPLYHVNIGGLTANTKYEFQAQLKYPVETIEDAAILDFTTNELSSPICFIATAAYGTPSAEQIDVLREFRDSVLLESTAGSVFVSLYYHLSPPVADFIAGNELLRTLVREFLIDPIVWGVEATGEVWRN